MKGPPGPVDTSQSEYAAMMSQMLASLSANQRDSQNYQLYQSDQNKDRLKKISLNDINVKKISEKLSRGKTCQDIIDKNPDTKSGYYFIDPAANGEPISVFCNMTSGQTCIEPAQNLHNYLLSSIENNDKNKVCSLSYT